MELDPTIKWNRVHQNGQIMKGPNALLNVANLYNFDDNNFIWITTGYMS
jgi:hypothetical protein